jgi:hypothetical protein
VQPNQVARKEDGFRPFQKISLIKETFLREVQGLEFSVKEIDKDIWRCQYMGFCFHFILSNQPGTNLPKGSGIVVGQGFEGSPPKKYTYFDLATKTYKPRNTWAEHLFIRIMNGRCILRFVAS